MNYIVFDYVTGEVFAYTEFEHQAYIVSRRLGRRYDFARRDNDGANMYPDFNASKMYANKIA